MRRRRKSKVEFLFNLMFSLKNYQIGFFEHSNNLGEKSEKVLLRILNYSSNVTFVQFSHQWINRLRKKVSIIKKEKLFIIITDTFAFSTTIFITPRKQNKGHNNNSILLFAIPLLVQFFTVSGGKFSIVFSPVGGKEDEKCDEKMFRDCVIICLFSGHFSPVQ